MMKKLTALLLCFLLLCTCSVTAAAAVEEETTDTVISVTVPDTHAIAVESEGAQVFYEGTAGTAFTVGRLSEPRLLIRAESGRVITAVTLDGEDVTAQLHGGYLELAPVYADKTVVVTTAEEPAVPEDTYVVRGRVTLDGRPLAGVVLELRSTLKTATTDKDGCFVFTDVETGKHSLTALRDDKVIGYLAFSLQKDSKADVTLLADGTYTVSVDKDGAGVDLHLELNEEQGTLTPAAISTISKADPNSPLTGDAITRFPWWLLLILAACIVVVETHRRKKTA